MADQSSPHVQRLLEAGLPVIDMPLNRKLDRAALRMIRETIREKDIDIIHAFTNRTVLYMVLATRGLPVKLVAYRGVIGNVSWLSPLSWYQDQPVPLDQFGIPESAVVVTCSSRLRPRKGLWELVGTLKLTDPKHNIYILFLGHEGNESLQSKAPWNMLCNRRKT